MSLAYNSSEPVRAIAGATLASQVVQAFNQTIASAGNKAKLTVQFGAYASFLAFFGVAGLLDLDNGDFRGVPDYASSMTFELFANDSVDGNRFPSAQDLNVRFLFHNGTTSNVSEPAAFPLFGQQRLSLPWSDFVTNMGKFAIGNEADWCHACGNTTGVCAPFTTSSSVSTPDGRRGAHDGLSRPVAGVIGAMVTLAVILGLEALILLAAGLRVVKKQKAATSTEGEKGKA